jgi:hypothetical protein
MCPGNVFYTQRGHKLRFFQEREGAIHRDCYFRAIQEQSNSKIYIEGAIPCENQKHDQKEIFMNKKVGLWLDQTKAVIVSITNNGEERRIITSDMEHYVRYSSNVPGDGSAEDVRDRRFWNHLGEYYDKVIAHIGDDARSILIFGPGEAKYELKKRLENVGMLDNIVSVDDADSLTDRQIATRVRERFPARAYFDIF